MVDPGGALTASLAVRPESEPKLRRDNPGQRERLGWGSPAKGKTAA